jgi:hypothetical protein
MAKNSGPICPLLNKPCVEHKCLWYIQVHGKNPQTGDPISQWQCAISFIPMLLIENSKQQHQTSAAIESFRNESVNQAQIANKLMAHSLNNLQISQAQVTDITHLPPS